MDDSQAAWTFTMPAAAVTVSASFTKADYDLTVSYTATEGSVSVDVSSGGDGTTAQYGDTVTIYVGPASGYAVDKVTIQYAQNGTTQSSELSEVDSAWSFTMPAAPVTVTVSFARLYTLTLADQSMEHGTLTSVTVDGQTAEPTETGDGKTLQLRSGSTVALLLEGAALDPESTDPPYIAALALSDDEAEITATHAVNDNTGSYSSTYTITMPAGDLTATPTFAFGYAVTYLPGDGTDTKQEVCVQAATGSTQVKLTLPGVSGLDFAAPAGLTFVGWREEVDGEVTAELLTAGSEVTITEPGTTYTAVWGGTVTFQFEGTYPSGDSNMIAVFCDAVLDSDGVRVEENGAQFVIPANETVWIEPYQVPISSIVSSDPDTEVIYDENAERLYRFTMPAANLTITVTVGS